VQTAQYSANGINNATKYNVNQGIMQLINNFKTIFKAGIEFSIFTLSGRLFHSLEPLNLTKGSRSRVQVSAGYHCIVNMDKLFNHDIVIVCRNQCVGYLNVSCIFLSYCYGVQMYCG